jgi:hypothetical protein
VRYWVVVVREIYILFWIICRVNEETREKPTFYPIDTLNDHPIKIGVEELGILDQNQPSGLKDLTPKMTEVCP